MQDRGFSLHLPWVPAGFSRLALGNQQQRLVIKCRESTESTSLGAESTHSPLFCLTYNPVPKHTHLSAWFIWGRWFPSLHVGSRTLLQHQLCVGARKTGMGTSCKNPISGLAPVYGPGSICSVSPLISNPFVLVRCRNHCLIKALTCWSVAASEISCLHNHISAACCSLQSYKRDKREYMLI